MLGRTDRRVEDLEDNPLFSACTRRELQEISRLMDEARFEAGTTLMAQGRAGRECFVILEGEASVVMDSCEIARAGPGEIVGEMALLEQEPRCATVVAATPLRALVMTRPTFTAVLDASPAVARRLLRLLAQRLRDSQSAA